MSAKVCSVSDAIDTTTPTGKLVFHITGAMAEFERTLISERPRAGMQAARRKGRQLGRPRRLSPEQVEQARYLARAERMSMAAIARKTEVGKTTAWRAVSARHDQVSAGLPNQAQRGAASIVARP